MPGVQTLMVEVQSLWAGLKMSLLHLVSWFLNLPFRANFYPMTGLSQRYYDDDDDDDLLTDLLIRRF